MLNQGRMVPKFVGRDSSFLFQTKVYQVHNNFCHPILGRFIKQNNPIICGEAHDCQKKLCPSGHPQKSSKIYGDLYNVRPPRYLSWFITSITIVYGTYNYSYWGKSKPIYNCKNLTL